MREKGGTESGAGRGGGEPGGTVAADVTLQAEDFRMSFRATVPAAPARPGPEGLRRVKLPLTLFNALARVSVSADGRVAELWVTLVLAPEWAAAHPDVEAPAPAPDLLRKLLSRLDAGRDAGAGSRPHG